MLKPHLLVLGYVWPEKTSSAAGVRDWCFIEAALNAGWKITYASPSKENEHSALLRRAGVSVETVSANDSRFDAFVRDLKPEVVLFDRFVMEEQFGWRVREQCPEALRVLDTQDLHFLRRGRERALSSRTKVSLQSEDLYRELGSIYRSDLSLVVSDFELNLLIDEFGVPSDLLRLCRFWLPEHEPSPAWEERKNFAFIGNFRHPPNADAVAWLNQEIWPKLRNLVPGSELHVFGAYPSKAMMELSDPEKGFKVVGPIKDSIAALGKYRVNLAPLRFGAGIKGKITDGWSAGTPCACTTIASEGMAEDLAWGGAVADDPSELATQAASLYSDEKLWADCQSRGYRILRELYSAPRLSAEWTALIVDSMQRLDEIRKRNHVGAMLWQHLHKSTKYFSRWIETKNQLAGQTL